MTDLALTAAREHVETAASHFQQANDRLQDAAAHYWLAGHELTKAKDAVAHGEWLPLLKAQRIPERTAQLAMKCARDYAAVEDAQDAAFANGGITRALMPPANPKPASDLDGQPEVEVIEPEPTRDDTLARLQPHVDSGAITENEAGEIVDAGLEHTVLTGTMTPADAAAAAAEDLAHEPPPDSEPTLAEVAIDELSEVRRELVAAHERIADLEEQVAFWKGECSDDETEREAVFTRQAAVIAALRAELDTEREHHNQLKASHAGAIKRIKELEAGA